MMEEVVLKPLEREFHKEAKNLVLFKKSLKSYMSILESSALCQILTSDKIHFTLLQIAIPGATKVLSSEHGL